VSRLNKCVRCGIETEEYIITRGNIGPLCRGCFNLYCNDFTAWRKWPKGLSSSTYGMISFSGETEAGPFWKQIQEGRKRTTIRYYRKDGKPHAVINAETPLYWRVRTPKDNKPVHLIGRAKVTGYREIRLLDIWCDEGAAKRDGFKDLNEFREWFYPKWFDFPTKIHDIVKAVSAAQKFDEIYVSYGRAFGKQSLMNMMDALTEPMCLIEFELCPGA